MNKNLIIIFILILAMTANAAEWSVMVTWTQSPDEMLYRETLIVDGVEKCQINKNDVAQCTFEIDTLSGQSIRVRSYTSQGGYIDSDSKKILSIGNPGSGIIVNITQLP